MIKIVVVVSLIMIVLTVCILKRVKRKDKFVTKENIEIYLINLPRSKDRFDNFMKFYNDMEYKVPYHYIEAVDARKLENSIVFKHWHESMNNSKTHNNYKALQLSVVKCLKYAKLQQSEWAIICEDDAELPKTINFEKVIQNYPDSKVIYLDNRNRGGDGYVPGCCMNCVMYHKSVYDMFIKELDPRTSSYFHEYPRGHKAFNDHYIPWLITKVFKIKCSSLPIVNGHGFKSTVRVLDT